jgi:pyridoxal 5'-phosphate synthase pdxT subunit
VTPTVGLVALQGGVREHRLVLEGLGARVLPLRGGDDLIGPDGPRVDAVLLPGGESSTIDKLLRMFDLFEPLRAAIGAGLPVLGTCAGLVLLATDVDDRAPGQRSLGLMDVTVRRNALGSQVDSAETELASTLGPIRVAFIRAPVVTRVGSGVEVLARRDDQVVAVRQGTMTGLSFHPELTGETVFHRQLLDDAAH